MANVSDVMVKIEAKGCAKEVQTWLKAIDKNAYYNICDDHTGTTREDLGENSADFCGIAEGRWTYQSNIEGAFGTQEQRKSWTSRPEVEIAYNALLLTLKENPEAFVNLTFTECETGWDFIGQGEAFLQFDKETSKVESYISYDELGDASIPNLIAYGFAESEQSAKEYLGIEED